MLKNKFKKERRPLVEVMVEAQSMQKKYGRKRGPSTTETENTTKTARVILIHICYKVCSIELHSFQHVFNFIF